MPFEIPPFDPGPDPGGGSGPPLGGLVVNLQVVADPGFAGDVVSFLLNDPSGILSVDILRSGNDQITSAVTVGVVSTSAGAKSFHDTDPVLAGSKWWYWVELVGFSDTQDFGPVYVSLKNPNTIPAAPINWFDASHDELQGISVQIHVTYEIAAGVDFFAMRIYVNGYQGSVIDQLISEDTGDKFSFLVKQTGETVTLKAVIVNSGGVQQTIGTASTKVIILGPTPTVPSRLAAILPVEGAAVTQVSFDGGLEDNITHYRLYRSARGDIFSNAVLVQEIPPTSLNKYSMSDTHKGASFQWYVTSVNATGESIPSGPVWPNITF